MPKTKFQRRIMSTGACTVDEVLEEIGVRLETINAYPPILPIVGTIVRDVVRELREVEGELLSDEFRADHSAATGSGA